MGSIWAFVRKPSNQRLLSWLGGGGAVAAAGIWAMVTYLWPAHEGPKVECVQQGVAIGGNVSGSTVKNTVSGGSPSSGPCLDTAKNNCHVSGGHPFDRLGGGTAAVAGQGGER